jgi:hypothetical protein
MGGGVGLFLCPNFFPAASALQEFFCHQISCVNFFSNDALTKLGFKGFNLL